MGDAPLDPGWGQEVGVMLDFVFFCSLMGMNFFPSPFWGRFLCKKIFASRSKDDFFFLETSSPSWKYNGASISRSCFHSFKSEVPINLEPKFAFFLNQNRQSRLIFSGPLEFHNTTPTIFLLSGIERKINQVKLIKSTSLSQKNCEKS